MPGSSARSLTTTARPRAIDDRPAASAAAGERPAGEHDDGILETFGLVDRQDAHHIVIVVDLRFLLARGVARLGRPGQEGGQAAAAGLGESARPLDELLQVGDGLRRPRPSGGQEGRGAREPHELGNELVRLTAPRSPCRRRRTAIASLTAAWPVGCSGANRSKTPPSDQERKELSSLKPK